MLPTATDIEKEAVMKLLKPLPKKKKYSWVILALKLIILECLENSKLL